MYYTKKEVATEQGADKIWHLSEASYDHGSPWSKEQFKLDLANETSEYLVLVDKECWIGFVSYQLILDEVEITHVAIHQTYQKQGYGSELLRKAVQEFVKKDILQIFLEVRSSNVPAQRLYEKIGFKMIRRRKNYYSHPKEDGFVMCLNVKEVSL
ncbi:ribosomal protein S18-alanine N-acetyltransferase [Candidatus Enterococcus mansonii]|uniref:[Ribosomal protein bS18]-alanine N-acetyltransferase n=1 Tax=Candidatus Enterococcus mansonii TaxID=1834181 RepID=A0A242CJF9_9ENTE|nr:ribosomal protein S18-alanine N-acetyltransferase [Enterococcus sp. 4G2_DIV0659]OTO10258.1 ribosomal-protein-alanine acetyltransferase [Enterococcus sp. 4G2_DIV0659]